MRTHGRPALALALALLGCTAAACDKSPFSDDPPAPSPEPPQPAAPEHRAVDGRGVASAEAEAGVALERSDPPPPAGDLKAEIDSFTSLDACVSQHANVDPLVGDAMRALGYDTLVRDACRVLQSLKLKDPSPCSGIAASGLQSRCEGLVAMEMHAPDRCPWVAPTERTLGRDPTCLAVATHDPRICAAAFTSQRATCEALATGDAKRCVRGTPEERRRCERDMEREASALVADEHEAHEATMPKGSVSIKGAAGTPDPDPAQVDVGPDVEPGIVVAPEPTGGMRIDVAHDRDTGLHLPGRGVPERARFAATVLVDDGVSKVTRFELLQPKQSSILCPSVHCTVKADVPKGEPKRGQPLSIAFDGAFDTPAGKYTLHAVVDSFVRDVVSRSTLYAPR